MRLTASNIVHAIDRLPKDRAYNYINPSTATQVKIERVEPPEGPIYISRKIKGVWRSETISSQMIWRIANAFQSGQPVNFDRVLGASYNNRSAFESLLAHTPEFYFCYPGRIELINDSSKVRAGHKHLLWMPERPHNMAQLAETSFEQVISEVPVYAVYDAIALPANAANSEIDIDVQRRHAQMQIALVLIGLQLGFRTWVARNDHSISYQGKRVIEMDSVIQSLNSVALLASYADAIKAALLIDCIWFRNARFMPAVMEIEHSTGVTSGLTRMKGLQDAMPPFPTRYAVVAPDELRHKVLEEGSREQFRSLDAKFFPYSAVEELFSLCQRRKLHGVDDSFLDCFMEPCIADQ